MTATDGSAKVYRPELTLQKDSISGWAITADGSRQAQEARRDGLTFHFSIVPAGAVGFSGQMALVDKVTKHSVFVPAKSSLADILVTRARIHALRITLAGMLVAEVCKRRSSPTAVAQLKIREAENLEDGEVSP
jgi:hypothetical protein